jgi:glutaminyl-tRNA synthetase
VSVVKDPITSEIIELHCTYDPATRGGASPDGRSPKATIHWVPVNHCVEGEARIYDQLFSKEDPDNAPDGNYLLNINKDSLKVVKNCKFELSLKNVNAGERFQFERIGYFCADPDTRDGKPVFNRTVSLKDEWARISKKAG